MSDTSAESAKAVNMKRIVVVGTTECGKTNLIKAFIEITDSYATARNYHDIALCNIDIDDTNVPILIFEAPCLQSYRGERSEMYQNADVIVLCFAVDDMNSLLCITSVWFREIKENRPDLPLVLVGNKCDLRSQDSAPSTISYSNGSLTARNISAFKYVECSANTKEGILEVFMAAAKATLG